MRLAYMPDTHLGGYNQKIPGHREVSQTIEHLLIEAETAERVGFDGIWLPERYARTETLFPSTIVFATASLSVDLRGSYTLLSSKRLRTCTSVAKSIAVHAMASPPSSTALSPASVMQCAVNSG